MVSRTFTTSIFGCFVEGAFSGFYRFLPPKRTPKHRDADSLFASKIDLGAQRDFCMHFDRLLAPFWLPFGSLCLNIIIFGCPSAHNGSLGGPSAFIFSPFIDFRKIFLYFSRFSWFSTDFRTEIEHFDHNFRVKSYFSAPPLRKTPADNTRHRDGGNQS